MRNRSNVDRSFVRSRSMFSVAQDAIGGAIVCTLIWELSEYGRAHDEGAYRDHAAVSGSKGPVMWSVRVDKILDRTKLQSASRKIIDVSVAIAG